MLLNRADNRRFLAALPDRLPETLVAVEFRHRRVGVTAARGSQSTRG